MTMTYYKPGRAALAVLVLLAMTLLLSPHALADGGTAAAAGPEAADTITIDASGLVTLLSDHLAGEEVSSLQLRLVIPTDALTGEIGFAFAVPGDRLVNYTVADGVVPAEDIPDNEEQTPVKILTIYVAGADPLMSPGQTQLALGTVSGALPDRISVLPQNGLQVVYGDRMATVTTAYALSQTEDTELDAAKAALKELLDQAAAIDQKAYTSDSLTVLMEAADAASKLYEDDTATKEQLEQAAEALRAAIGGLVLADRADLAAAIAEAEAYFATVEAGKYTPESYAALQTAITAAKTLLNDADATPEQLAAALAKLSDPAKLLVPVAAPEGGGSAPGGSGDGSGMGGDGGSGSEPTAAPTDAPAEETAAPTTAPTTSPTTAPTATAAAAVPNTGDETALAPWMALLCLSAGLLAVLAVRRGKANR